jgi:pimeloyl-ACP methyl ester carboxylesterase
MNHPRLHLRGTTGAARRLTWLAALALLPGATGCIVSDDRPAPGQIHQLTEPVTGRTYHLYVPTAYDRRQTIPLMVTCHGTPPWDTAALQLDEWKGLAEAGSFLVAAPELVGTRGDFPPEPQVQIERQREDERLLLAMVQKIEAAYNVDENRVFMTGWSAGAYAVMFTGLRHPEVFRALAVRQGTFEQEFVEPCIPFLDRYQPIFVSYSDYDPLDDATPMIDWLREYEMEPVVDMKASLHKREPDRVFAFFEDVVRSNPYVRVVIQEDPSDPMTIRFHARTSFEPASVLWDFGDHARSADPRPVHTYVEPGLYTVKFAAWTPAGKAKVRYLQLQLPRLRLGVQQEVSASD